MGAKLGDIYFANAEVIRENMQFFRENGVDFFNNWETNEYYKGKLSQIVAEDRCFIVDASESRLYRYAKKNVDYKIVNPFSEKMDLVPII